MGCPLSPLCFAVAADLLLRRLQRLFPQALVRAYADDLAMVLPSTHDTIAPLVQVFEEYALISGLQLNLPKTVMVPLAPVHLLTYRAHFRVSHPQWRNIQVAFKAKYLGLI